MIYKEIFEEAGPARDYATRMSKSDAPAYEFDLDPTEIKALEGGKTLVLVVGHDESDTNAIVLTRVTAEH